MLNRWDPFAEIARLHDEMTRLTGTPESSSYRSGLAVPVDIVEEKDAILVKAEVPGLKADDVHVSVENDVLTLKGERKFEKEDDRSGYLRVERSYGSFVRSFSLPKTVDAERVEADLTDGVLTVRIPKKAAPEPKRIDVRQGASKTISSGKPS